MSLDFGDIPKVRDIILRSAPPGAIAWNFSFKISLTSQAELIENHLELLKKKGIRSTRSHILLHAPLSYDPEESPGETAIRYFDYVSEERDAYGLQQIYVVWLYVPDDIATKILVLGELPLGEIP